MVLAVPLRRVRLDLGGREVARESLDLLLVGAQLKIHAASIRLSLYDMSVIDNTTYLLYCAHEQRRSLARRPPPGGSHPGRAGPSSGPLAVGDRSVGERPGSAGLETLRDLIRACRLDLTFGLANYDDSYVPEINARASNPWSESEMHWRATVPSQASGTPQLPDFDPEPILRVLNEHEVRYVVVGAIAAIAQGYPLNTGDLDLTPARDPQSRTARRGSADPRRPPAHPQRSTGRGFSD